MFWCSSFVHNKLHALAHPQPLSWMVAPQQAVLLELRGWHVLGVVQAADSTVFLNPSSSYPLDLAGFPGLSRPHREEAEP